ncbi:MULTISPECIES: hypothetical protein [Labrys]|uniref:Uncharacterized protein n=1 Tax=Labrys neptuniae TaxID=376174 RepID=A0ABV3PXS6_9HYPH
MYCYLTIRPPSPACAPSDTRRLVAFLQTLPDLRQKHPVSFGHAPGKPWVDLTIVKTTDSGEWASNGEFIPFFDRVVLVGTESPPCFGWYSDLATRIAEFLGWEAMEDGENQLIHPKRDYPE